MKEATTYTRPNADNSDKSGAARVPQKPADRAAEVDQANAELADEKLTRATDEQPSGDVAQDISER